MDEMNRGDADASEQAERVTPFDGRFAERVVPAEGDPAEPWYQARLRGERNLPPQYRAFWTPMPVARRRGGARWWLMAALIVAFGLLLLRPLAVLATILFAVLLVVLVVGLLATGTLLLAARVVLGGRTPVSRATWHPLRR